MFWGLAPEAPSSGRTGGVEGAGTNGQRYPAWGSALGPGTALSSCRGVPTASLSDIPRSSLSPHPQQGRVCAITLTAAPACTAAHGHTRVAGCSVPPIAAKAFASRARNGLFSGSPRDHRGPGMGGTGWQRPRLRGLLSARPPAQPRAGPPASPCLTRPPARRNARTP